MQGSNLPCHGVLVKAVCPGQSIDVGITSAVASGAGFKMADGDVLDFQVKNANELYFIASAAAQQVCFFPYALY